VETDELAADWTTPQDDVELRVAPSGVAAAVLCAGVVTAFLAEFAPLPDGATGWGMVAIWTGGGLWLLASRHPLLARWLLSLTILALSLLAGVWVAMPMMMLLLPIAAVAAEGLLGTAAGLTMLLLESALVIGLPAGWLGGEGGDATLRIYLLLPTWGSWGLMVAAYGRMQRSSRWLHRFFVHSQTLLVEARGRRLELERAMGDLRHLNRQLAVLNERMAMLRLAAEEAEQAQAAFVANVSHELRTPLNMIVGLTGIIVEKPETYAAPIPEDLAEDLSIVYRNAHHLQGMINDVLSLSQLEAGRVRMRRERTDMAAIVEAVVDAVRPLMDKKGLHVDVDLPACLPPVFCDPVRIRQVILNLVSNAARFTDAGGVSVRVSATDQRVLICVEDTGPGIDPALAERIFEPFCHDDDGIWRERGGTGLGLSISQEFVRRHGGRIWLDSAIGVGTTFCFELPISPPVEPAARPAGRIRSDWIWQENRFRTEQVAVSAEAIRPRVVVLDETGGLKDELCAFVDDVEIAEVDDVGGAVEEADRLPILAALVNARRRQELWPIVEAARARLTGIPVLGFTIPSRLQRARRAGALDYLTKPVSQEQLVDALSRVELTEGRVLVVDDSEDFLRYMERTLAVLPTVKEIRTATTGKVALEQMRATRFDLTFLDIVLPDMDGWEVLHRCSDLAAGRQSPVVFVSAQDPMEHPAQSQLLLVSASHGLPALRLLDWALGLAGEMSVRLV
jgi:signal transduction histidine kinase/CheY-like chemotaxis protein